MKKNYREKWEFVTAITQTERMAIYMKTISRVKKNKTIDSMIIFLYLTRYIELLAG